MRRLGLVLHQQVLAEGIEAVAVKASLVRALQPLAQLDIEDSEAQTAGRLAVFHTRGQPHPVVAGFGKDARPFRLNKRCRRLSERCNIRQGPRNNDEVR